MKTTILKWMGISAFAVVFFILGSVISAFSFTYLELNDRLKYEVAYLKGFVAIQKKIKEGDIKGAEVSADFLIDAHARTLYEYDFITSPFFKTDMNEVLCEVVSLRKKYPASRPVSSENYSDWLQEVDEYLSESNWKC
ncbi:hypothetical protein [Zooshikella harenae]|uniref:Uncharacterized protein n=1 Tax=Zooshikella harenae TaxID=2827238 RepID=A0ABS5ZJY2_9GAMM|nr:hypothetical protein [Zooshikella harenae]MBU2714398.1 hypothetical protein [Zooshikella harenae]